MIKLISKTVSAAVKVVSLPIDLAADIVTGEPFVASHGDGCYTERKLRSIGRDLKEASGD